ncbi:MAG: amidohydrolase family protein, partial [Maritimibacter sp.]|nr:amidohydrolase family protein [Maritimibacter sp.]
HFANLALAHRQLADRLCLVTDAMLTLAGTTTAFRIGEKLIHRDGKQLSDADGTLAGAHLALDEAVRNATVRAGFPLADALYAASVNPLRALGLESSLGHVAPGRDASLTMLNDKLSAVGVYADGRLSDLGGA